MPPPSLERAKSCLKTNALTLLTLAGVFTGIVLGLILRTSSEEPWSERDAMYVAFVGDLFLRMLKALIIPLIVSSLISAVGNLDLSLSGKIGARAVAYYMVTTVMAVVLGIILVVAIHPGEGTDEGIEKVEFGRNTTTADTLMDLVRWVPASAAGRGRFRGGGNGVPPCSAWSGWYRPQLPGGLSG